MGGLVERQFARAVDARATGDLRLVTQVLTDEDDVNRMHIETDLRCNQIIAKRQPIAVDLREMIAVIHSINDLERIGDEAKKIALKAHACSASGRDRCRSTRVRGWPIWPCPACSPMRSTPSCARTPRCRAR